MNKSSINFKTLGGFRSLLIGGSMKRVAIIILNWNKSEQTISLINNILKLEVEIEPTFIIVDNNSKEIERKILLDLSIQREFILINEQEYKMNLVDKVNNKFIVLLDENYGYAKGNNYGLKLAGKLGIEYSLICNNDIIIEQPVIEKLIEKLNENKSYALVGPKIIGINGEQQGPYDKPTLVTEISHPLLLPLIPNKLSKKLFSREDMYFPYRIMGCFMLIKTRVMSEINYFDENTFLYAEELILAEKLRYSEYKTVYLPEVYIKHIHGFSTSDLGNKKIFSMKLKSDLYYFKNYRKYNEINLFLIKLSRKTAFYLLTPAITKIKNFIGYIKN